MLLIPRVLEFNLFGGWGFWEPSSLDGMLHFHHKVSFRKVLWGKFSRALTKRIFLPLPKFGFPRGCLIGGKLGEIIYGRILLDPFVGGSPDKEFFSPKGGALKSVQLKYKWAGI